jgi:hypothetical protein
MEATTNLLGVLVTHAVYGLCVLTFVFRLLGKPQVGYWFGYPLLLMALPLAYLLLQAGHLSRPLLFYVQICLMLAFLVVEAVLDYILKTDFRHVRWMLISYVTLFFAATGGMLGVAAYGGRIWTLTAVILFSLMAVLAFVQRAVTGM